MPDLIQTLVGTNTLPSPPGIALEIMRLNEDEEVSITELGAVISRDPALAAKLLRMANSSSMGRPGQVADIEDAVMVLGTRSVNLLALSFSLTSCSDSRSTFFDYAKFWTQSACNTVAARLLAETYAKPQRDEAFLAGLLCDFAQLMLAEAAPREYEPVVQWHRSNGGELRSIEFSQLGAEHAEFGREILQHWGLPANICEAIGAHHDPQRLDSRDTKVKRLAQILHVASICGELFVDHSEEHADALVALGASYFDMSPDGCQELLDNMYEGVSEFLDVLDLQTVDADKMQQMRTKASEILVRESLELNQRVQSITGTLERLSNQNVQLERSARTDSLTGLHNRLFLEELLARELDNAAWSGGSVGLLIADVDEFKRVNDTHGHLAGDTILKEISRIITGMLSFGQSAVRCGGDEFIIVCVDITQEALLDRAQVIRRAVEETPILCGSIKVRTSLSIGGSLVSGKAAEGARTELLESADSQLYRAKEKGRNRVFVTALKEGPA